MPKLSFITELELADPTFNVEKVAGMIQNCKMLIMNEGR
jgi:hypothetical protein